MNITIDTWLTEEEMYDLGLMEYADDADTRVIPTEYLPRVPPDELQFLMYEDSAHIPSGEFKDSLLRLKSMGKTLSYFSKTYIKIPFHLYKKFPKEFNNLYTNSPEYFYNFPIPLKGIPNYLNKIFNLSKHFNNLSDYYQTVSKSFDFLLKRRSESLLNSVVKPKKFTIKNLIDVKNLEKKTFIPLVRAYSHMKFLYLWNCMNDSSSVILKDSTTTRLYQELAAPEIAQKEKIFKKISQFHTELTDWQLEILDNLKVYTLTSKRKPERNKNLIPSLLKQSKLGYYNLELSKNLLQKILAHNMVTWKRFIHNSNTAYKHLINFFVRNEQNLLDRFKKRLNPLESTKYQYISSINAKKIKESSLFNTVVPKESSKIVRYKNPMKVKTEYEKYVYNFNKNEIKTFLFSNSEFSSPFTNSFLNNIVKSSTALSRGSVSLFPTVLLSTSKVSFYDMLIESILYKTYDRYENHSNLLLNQFSKILFYKLKLKKYLQELELESLKNMIKTEYLYNYSVFPNRKIEYYKPNDFIFCFLNKNDVNNLFFSSTEKPFLHKQFNKAYKESFDEKNFGSLYRLYVEKNKNILKNKENQKSLLLIPSSENFKNKEEKKIFKKNVKKDKFLEGFSFSWIKIYLLDFNDQLPQIKFSRNKKNICFYPLNSGKTVNFYLPYSFDKTKILKNWKNEKTIFGKLIKKRNVKSYEIECIDGDFVSKNREIEFEPKVVEMDLSEFLKLTNGFSLKNQKIIPIKY